MSINFDLLHMTSDVIPENDTYLTYEQFLENAKTDPRLQKEIEEAKKEAELEKIKYADFMHSMCMCGRCAKIDVLNRVYERENNRVKNETLKARFKEMIRNRNN